MSAGREELLTRRLRELGRFAVAFSGGLDSRFLIHMAFRAGVAVQALHVNGPHTPFAEHAAALAWAERLGVPLAVLPLDPLSMPALRNNPKDRCYHCKKALFTALREAAGDLPLADGTNASDFGGYRPGLKALAELKIISPLADAGLTKTAIRQLAVATGMDDPEQAAQPCLLTRFNYGLAIPAKKLAAADAAERAVSGVLRNAFPGGPPEFRLRWPDAKNPVLHLARSESCPAPGRALLDELRRTLAPHGLSDIPIESVDSLSGYFDRL